MSDTKWTDTESYLVTVELIVPSHMLADHASELETEIENELTSLELVLSEERPDGDGNYEEVEVEIEIGAVGGIDPKLIDDGIRYRQEKVSKIPSGSGVLIWQDVDGQWSARVHAADVWPVTRYDTAEEAIQGRDRMRDYTNGLTNLDGTPRLSESA